MSRYVFKLPDLGEGTVSSEIVAWRVKPGDVVEEDQPLVEMSTDKAVIDVPAPVTGRVVSLAGKAGDVVAVGAELVVFETDAAVAAEAANGAHGGAAHAKPNEAVGSAGATSFAANVGSLPVKPGNASAEAKRAGTAGATTASTRSESAVAPDSTAAKSAGSPDEADNTTRLMASPATRRRAREAGIDLTTVTGSGPGGRIQPQDFEAALTAKANGHQARADSPTTSRALRSGTTEIKVVGVRRVIAQRMAEAKRTIPHFSYVEEVDVTELEALRVHCNSMYKGERPSLTYLPFFITALTRALQAFPQCNAHYDAERDVIIRHHAVHVGVATQTPDGLKVPVVKHAEALSVWELATAVQQVSDAARTNRATRQMLTGSTITVTSLGKLGGIVSTPVINSPEVSIVGVNKAIDRPVVLHGAITVRRMMNISSSFDHRFVDGFDAAAMIQRLKQLLEHPATIFMAD